VLALIGWPRARRLARICRHRRLELRIHRRPHRARGGGGDRLPERRTAGGDAEGRRLRRHRDPRRRRRRAQRPPDAVSGRPAGRPGAAAARARDHGAGCGLPGRAGGGLLGIGRGHRTPVAGREALRAGHGGRPACCAHGPLDARGRACEAVG